MDEHDSSGSRIAAARKAHGLSQRALAERARVSYSLLTKIEQGDRDATPGVVAALAKALAIDVADLTGQPYHQDGRRRDRIHEHIPALRRALMYWDVAPAGTEPPRPAAELQRDVDSVAAMRRTAQHTRLAMVLPGLLLETTRAAHAATGKASEDLYAQLVILLFAAHSVTNKVGYQDLATVVEDRIAWAGERSGDPLMGAVGTWTRTTSMLATGAYDIGQQLLNRTCDNLTSRNDDAVLRMLGSLHLRSSMLAARNCDAETANEQLREARELAVRLGDVDHDGGYHQMCFGPSNVGIHEVAVAVELGDGARAVHQARRLQISAQIPRIRTAQHYVDLARAQLWEGDQASALDSLNKARHLAPQQTLHHPTTREVTRMLVRLHRRSNDGLTRLAKWVGEA